MLRYVFFSPFQGKHGSALGKWGRTQMGSDRFNRILTGFYLLGPVRVRLVPSGPPKYMISRGFYRIVTGF